jgi:hypothetical protein
MSSGIVYYGKLHFLLKYMVVADVLMYMYASQSSTVTLVVARYSCVRTLSSEFCKDL